MQARRILVVEDESIVALDLKQRLQAMGLEVVATVATGAAALDKVRSHHPDLILMDIQIKGNIDGVETAALVHQECDTPIVFLTANSDRSTIDRAKSAGPLAYLLKPFEDRELQTTIEIALDRHHLERRLKESEQWLSVTLASISDGVVAFDKSGKITYLNPVASQLTGWSLEEAKGRPASEILRLSLKEFQQCASSEPVTDVLRRQSNPHFRYYTLLTRRDGVQIAVEDTGAPIKLPSGELIGVVLVLRDVTARILTERQLHDSEQRVARVFETVQEGLGEVDERECIRFCNPAFAHILGEERPEFVIGRSVLEYMSPESSNKVAEQMSARKSGIVTTYELCITPRVGEDRTVLLTAAPLIDAKGSYAGAVGAMVDITERKRMEVELNRSKVYLEEQVQARTEELRGLVNELRLEIDERKRLQAEREAMSERLQRAEKMEALGMLAGGVAHDLNNTLGPLVGYPELMLRKLPEDSPLRRTVEKIGQAAQDAASTISDLLTLARRGRYEMHPLSMTELVKEYCDSPGCARLLAEHPDKKFVTKFDEAAPSILGSAPHLSKVVMNLVTNAFDAIQGAGTVTVQVSHSLRIALESGHENIKSGDYVELRVSDTGCGIAKEDLPKIFEPYYSKKKMGRSGTGLGLSVVYGVVRDHSGYYDVLSEVGRGTTFILYFPATEQQIIKHDRQDVSGGHESLLIVDDDVEQREMAVEILTSLGYQCEPVAGGREAIHYLQTHDADLVLLDMIMEPGFDGLDTFKEILKTKPRQKALIVSGFSANERAEEVLRLGASGFLKKPYTLESISKAIRAALDSLANQPGDTGSRTSPIPTVFQTDAAK